MKMNEQHIPTMLTLREMSKLTGLSYDFLRKLCIRGQVVHIRSGNKIFINADRFIDYLNGGESLGKESRP